MRSKTSLLYTSLLVIAILIVLNFLASRFFLRFDLTSDKRYSLSKATITILKSLEEPVTVTAYFSKKLPPEYASVRRDFKDMLTEYKNISKGMVAYEFVDPIEDETVEQQVQQKGIVQAQIPGREKDEFKIQKAYLGAEVQMGDNSEVISLLQSTEGMEYFLTTSIKKLSVHKKPVVGFLQGQGETPLRELGNAVHSLSVLYETESVTLSDSSSELDKLQALAIVAPVDSFTQNQLDQLDRFLADGKGIFLAFNRVDVDPSKEAMGHAVNTGLETWLAKKGIIVNENFVLDAHNMPVGIQQQAMTPFGPGLVTRQIEFPFFPVVQNFVPHPITAGLNQVVFRFVSSIDFAGDSTLNYTPIIKSSEHSGTQSVSAWLNYMKEWNESDFPLSGLTLAAAVKGHIQGSATSKLVVVADGDIEAPASQQGPLPDNVNLMVNSIDWLSDDTGLIDLRTKGTTARPIRDDLSEGKRTFLKFLNFLLPIVIIIVIGIVKFELRRNKRIKRMEVGYV